MVVKRRILRNAMEANAQVLSVPAGLSYDLVLEHLIYSCPDRFHYDTTHLITFRTAEGHMEKIFRIDEVHRLNPLDIDATYDVAPDRMARVRGYISVARNRSILTESGSYRFYFVTEERDLPHLPETAERANGPIYFTAAELMRGTRIVCPI